MSNSSFSWPMRLMSPSRARAMRVLYGVCRCLDDIADGDLPQETKIAQLEAWRKRYHCGELPPDIAALISDYMLPITPFDMLIDAMLMDARGLMRHPNEAELARYCDGAAGAVGLLSLPILGASANSEPLAMALGQILQRINIRRDIEEDAARGRVYTPKSWSAQRLDEDIATRLAGLNAPREDRIALLPAFAMLGVYLQLWKQLKAEKSRHLSALATLKGMTRGLLWAHRTTH